MSAPDRSSSFKKFAFTLGISRGHGPLRTRSKHWTQSFAELQEYDGCRGATFTNTRTLVSSEPEFTEWSDWNDDDLHALVTHIRRVFFSPRDGLVHEPAPI